MGRQQFRLLVFYWSSRIVRRLCPPLVPVRLRLLLDLVQNSVCCGVVGRRDEAPPLPLAAAASPTSSTAAETNLLLAKEPTSTKPELFPAKYSSSMTAKAKFFLAKETSSTMTMSTEAKLFLAEETPSTMTTEAELFPAVTSETPAKAAASTYASKNSAS